eukprot:Skav233550  [mRNA]  locus=scaffold563:298467:308991:- [translate_table: standard]
MPEAMQLRARHHQTGLRHFSPRCEVEETSLLRRPLPTCSKSIADRCLEPFTQEVQESCIANLDPVKRQRRCLNAHGNHRRLHQTTEAQGHHLNLPQLWTLLGSGGLQQIVPLQLLQGKRGQLGELLRKSSGLLNLFFRRLQSKLKGIQTTKAVQSPFRVIGALNYRFPIIELHH